MIHDRLVVGPSPDCARSGFLRGLGARQRSHLMLSFTERRLAAGETLPAHTNEWSVLIVQSGALAEEMPHRLGSSQMFGLVLPGELRCPMGRRLAHARFRALTDTTLRTCSPDRLALMQTRAPRLRLNLLYEAQSCLAETMQAQLMLGRMTASERIASLTLGLWHRQGCGAEVPLHLNREEMGQLTGLTIETVSRQIRALARKGVIALPSPSRLRVLDEAGLASLTGRDTSRRRAA